MPEIMKAKIFDPEHFACSCESNSQCGGRVWENALVGLRHRFNDSGSLWGKLAKGVISLLISWMLHRPHQHAGLVVVLPHDARDLFEAPCAEQREHDNLLHRHRMRAPPLHHAEMLQDAVEFSKRRPALS